MADTSAADAALDRWNADYPPSSPPPQPSSGSADAMKALEGSQQRQQDILKQEEAEKSPAIDRAIAANRSPMPAAPKLDRVGSPPQSNLQQQMQEWLMPAVALSALAGAFTRRHVTTSLNAFSGAVQGFKEGNLTLYDQKLKEWKAANEQAIQNNEAAIKEYNAAWNDRKANIDQKMNEIQLIAAKYQDRLTYEAAASKNFTLVAQMLQKQEYLQDQLKVQYERLKVQSEAAEAKMDDLKRKLETSDPFAMAERLEAIKDPEEKKRALQMIQTLHPQGAMMFGDSSEIPAEGIAGLNNEAINQRAQMAAHGNLDGAYKGIGGNAIGSRLRNIISNKAAQIQKDEGIDPNQAAIDFRSKAAGATAGARTGATKAANLELIFRNAEAAIPAAVEASDKVGRSKFVPLNKLLQASESQISDPDLKDFRLKNLQLAELWARAMNPNGVMRESDRSLALEMLSTADSPETYKRVVQNLTGFLQRERKAVEEFRAGTPVGAAAPTTAEPATGGGGGNINYRYENGKLVPVQ